MAIKIILVGGISDEGAPGAFLERLRLEIPQDVEWEWVWATQAEMFQPAHKVMMRLLDQLRTWSTARKKFDKSGGPEPNPSSLIVVKLCDLHGRAASALFQVWPDPIQIPAHVRSSDDVLRWLAAPKPACFLGENG